jgi:hypothetical protein
MPSAYLTEIAATGVLGVRIIIDPAPLVLATDGGNFASLVAPIISSINDVIGITNAVTGKPMKVVVDLHVRAQSGSPSPSYCSNQVTIQADTSASPCWQQYVTMAQNLGAVLEADYGGSNVCSGVPCSSLVSLEFFNEPLWQAFPNWNVEVSAAVAQVRRSMPTLTIWVAGNEFASDASAINAQYCCGLTNLTSNGFDGNVGFVVHEYKPFIFTAQSQPGDAASGTFGSSYVSGLEFPPNPANQATNIANATANINNDTRLSGATQSAYIAYMTTVVDAFYSTPEDAAYLDGFYAGIAQWADNGGVARNRIWVGEFGAISASAGNQQVPSNSGSGNALPGATLTDKANYLRQATTSAASRGMGWGLYSIGAGSGPGYQIDNSSYQLHCSLVTAVGLTAPAGCVSP